MDDVRAQLIAFWERSRQLREILEARAEEAVARIPVFQTLLGSMSKEARAQQAARSDELQRLALVEGDWAPYLDDLRAQAPVYAQLGVEFRDWFAIIESYRQTFIAEVLSEESKEQRDVLLGMARFLDTGVAHLGEAYIDAKASLLSTMEEQLDLYRDMFLRATYGKLIYEWAEPPDPGSFRLVLFNPTAAEIAGEDLSAYVGVLARDRPPPPCFGEEAPAHFAHALESKGDVGWSVEHASRSFDLRCFWIAKNRYVGVVFMDNTERRRMERALAMHLEELERSNRELDDFAYVTSHDLRSPLSDVRNLAQWLAEDLGDSLPAGSARHLQLMQDRIVRMEGLLDDLLEYSRVGRLTEDAREFDAGEVVQEVLSLVAPPDGFEVVFRGEPVTFHTPRTPFATVVRNLVSNAIKHHDRERGSIVVEVARRGDRAEVRVIDDGPGIAPEFHERVFRMFQTLRPRDEVEGSGVGLALVKKTVEVHGGTVRIESSGRGTTIAFTWPLRWQRGEGGL